MSFAATVFLRGVLVLIGIGALTFLLVEPHFEGRNAHATLFAIYFKDPFLAYMYVASVAFFVGLYHALKVLAYAGRNRGLSPAAISSVRTVKYCALALIGFVVGAEVFIMLSASDDRAGGVFMGLLILLASTAVAAAAAVLERTLQKKTA